MLDALTGHAYKARMINRTPMMNPMWKHVARRANVGGSFCAMVMN